MKYLKLFEEMTLSYGSTEEDEIKKKSDIEINRKNVNFDLIDNLKDMSLDYLDKGYVLNVSVCYKHRDYYQDVLIGCFYKLTYSHDGEIDHEMTHKALKSDRIIYYVYLIEGSWPSASGLSPEVCEITMINSLELIDRISEVYPDVNIKYIPR